MGRIQFLDKLLFTKHLSIMLKSGIPLSEGVSIIAEQSTNPTFKRILLDIESSLKNGQSLYTSLSKHPQDFDQFYIHLVRIGEESGNLDSNLNYLAVSLKKNYDFKKKVQGALLYPELVLATAFIVGAGISIFVLPQLVDLFKSMDIKLPLTTRILIAFAQIMKSYGILIIGSLVGLFLFMKFFVNQSIIKPHWHKLLLTLPVFGKFLQHTELSSLCRNMGMILKSGLPITSALDTQLHSTSNLVYKDYIETIKKGVAQGKPINETITQHHMKYFPTLASRMIGVGEKTGRLDESFLYLGDFFEDEVDSSAKDFSTVLEPIMLLGVGLVVAYLALAIISPIYQFTGSIRR